MTDEAVLADKLLNAALEGKSEDFKKRVWDYVGKSGLVPNDPLFLILVATGRLEVLLEDAPDRLEQLFKSWNKELSRNLELVEGATVERQKLAISSAVSELIKQAEEQEAGRLYTSIYPAAGLVTAILGLGFILGMSIPAWLAGGLSEPQRLTINRLEALQWAESDEGKLARNLIKWNGGYLDTKKCQQDAQRLKITAKGNEVTHNRLLTKDLDNFDYIERKQLTKESLAGLRDMVEVYGKEGKVPIETWAGGKREEAKIEKMPGKAFVSSKAEMQIVESGKHLQVRDLEGNLMMKAYGDKIEKPMTREQSQDFQARYAYVQQVKAERSAQSQKQPVGMEIGAS